MIKNFYINKQIWNFNDFCNLNYDSSINDLSKNSNMLGYFDTLRFINLRQYIPYRSNSMVDWSQKIIGLVIALLLAGILLPIGLDQIALFTSTNTTIQTLVTTVIPVMAVLSIVMLFVKTRKGES